MCLRDHAVYVSRSIDHAKKRKCLEGCGLLALGAGGRACKAGAAGVEAGRAARRRTASTRVEDEGNDEPVQTEHLGENENENHANEELQRVPCE